MLDRTLDLVIRWRWLVVLVTLATAVWAVGALSRLPIDAVPDITNRQVQINSRCPGLSANDVERQVAFPLETALAGIPGLDHTRSLSRSGFNQVTAVFHDDTDIYFARQQIGERLLDVRASLPPGVDTTLGPIATGLGEVVTWTIGYAHPQGRGAPEANPGWHPGGVYVTPEGQTLREPFEHAAYLRTIQDWIVRPQIKTVPGVAGVDVIGGYVMQYHVEADPMRLLSHGIGFRDLIGALERNNTSVGAGYIELGGEALQVRSDGRLSDYRQIDDIVVGSVEGAPMFIRDVANVSIGRELRTGAGLHRGEEAVIGTALMRIGQNSREVASAVTGKLRDIARSLPPDVRLEPLLDRSRLVDATIRTVRENLSFGAGLVMLVLFVILGNARAALITALVIPLAMLATAMGMIQSGISGNLMSLGALDFGLIVDGAVIIVENCLRRLHERQSAAGRSLRLDERLRTVFDATRQVARPSAFGQAIIITVYLPILALSGIEGKMFRPMAATVIVALLAAFVLSMSFVPAMVALLLGRGVADGDSRLLRNARAAYACLLNVVLDRPRRVLAGAMALIGGAALAFLALGQEFIPVLDEQDLAIQALRIPSTSLSQSLAMQADVERIVAGFPEVATVYSKTGTAEMATDPMPPNISDTIVVLKPRRDWPMPDKPKTDLVEELEAALDRLPGNQYEFTQPIQMRFNELIAGVRGDVALKLFGDSFGVLQPTAEKIGRLLRTIPGAADVKVEQTQGFPVLAIDVDRAAIARYGLDVAEVQQIVSTAIGGHVAGLVFEGDRRFPLIVRVPDAQRNDLAALRRLPVPLPGPIDRGHRGFVPLAEISSIATREDLNQVSRENGKRRIVVQANVRGRDLGSFVADARRLIDSELAIPSGYWLEWGGQYEHLVQARARLQFVLPACFALVFLLLWAAVRSMRQAALIFSAVPFAWVGGVASLWLCSMPFSITAAVGFIALSGVAVLNGLVMVSFIDELDRGDMPLRRAVIEGASMRLRPVLTTALVASLGFVPMALATGTGAEVQKPLAIVVIGGLISSTGLTLIVLPPLYRLIGTTRRRSDTANRDAR